MKESGSKEAIIIPVASGKGGVGKSLFTANLAMALARLGHETIAVDVDLGGSNLHTYLGLQNRYPGVGDFLIDRCGELGEMVVPTDVSGLGFLAGDGRNPFMANITHGHKMRLIRALKNLPARYVLLDLGAGSAYNTLDLFTISAAGLVVTTPEIPAVMNLMTFLKSLVLRTISREVGRQPALKRIVDGVRSQPARSPAATVEQLIAQIAAASPEAAARVRSVCARLRPRLVVNSVEHPDELSVLRPVEEKMRQRLSLEVEFFGCLFHDPVVRTAMRSGRPLLMERGDSLFARGVDQVADRLVRLWESPIPDSRERLLKSAAGSYHQWVAAGEE